jgi:hypothetical protein
MTGTDLAARLADPALTPAQRTALRQQYNREAAAEAGIDAYSLAALPKPGGAR